MEQFIVKESCSNKECPYANMDIDENDFAGLFEKFCACLDCEESESEE